MKCDTTIINIMQISVVNVLPYVTRSTDVSTLQEGAYYYFHSRLKNYTCVENKTDKFRSYS